MVSERGVVFLVSVDVEGILATGALRPSHLFGRRFPEKSSFISCLCTKIEGVLAPDFTGFVLCSAPFELWGCDLLANLFCEERV